MHLGAVIRSTTGNDAAVSVCLGNFLPEGRLTGLPERQSQPNHLCKPLLMLLSYAVCRLSVWCCVCSSAPATRFQLNAESRSVSRETVADSRDGTPR